MGTMLYESLQEQLNNTYNQCFHDCSHNIKKKACRLLACSDAKYMKLAGRECPDRLENSCKGSSINLRAAGLRLSRCNHGFFLLPGSFSSMFVT